MSITVSYVDKRSSNVDKEPAPCRQRHGPNTTHMSEVVYGNMQIHTSANTSIQQKCPDPMLCILPVLCVIKTSSWKSVGSNCAQLEGTCETTCPLHCSPECACVPGNISCKWSMAPLTILTSWRPSCAVLVPLKANTAVPPCSQPTCTCDQPHSLALHSTVVNHTADLGKAPDPKHAAALDKAPIVIHTAD